MTSSAVVSQRQTQYWNLMGWLTNHWRFSALVRATGALVLVVGARQATGGFLWLVLGVVLMVLGVLAAHIAPDVHGERLLFGLSLGGLLLTALVYVTGGQPDGYAFAGGLFLILWLGQALALWRRSALGAPWRGPVWLSVCFVAFLIGLWQLSSGLDKWTLWALGLSVLLAPIGVSVMTEDLLRGLPQPQPGARKRDAIPRKLLAAGVVLVLVPAVVLVLGPATVGPMALAMGAILFLVFAVATSAQADVAVFLVIAAVLFAAGPSSVALAEQDAADPGEDVVVALGDSFMSGEGAQWFYDGTNDKGHNECRRAPSAYVEVLARGGGILGAHDIAFLACSGAKAIDIYAQAQHTNEKTPRHVTDGADARLLNQLTNLERLEAVGDLNIKLLLLSIGGNDAGFRTIGTACLAPGDCSELDKQFSRTLDDLGPKLAKAYFEVKKAVDGRFPVAVVPYPIPLSEKPCSAVWLTGKEQAFLYGFTVRLNRVVRDEATRADLPVVTDIETALEPGRAGGTGLRLCDDDDLDRVGVNFIGLRSVSGQVEQRLNPANWVHNSLHPNEAGHAAMAKALTSWLGSQGPLKPAPRVKDNVGEPPAPTALRPCDVTDIEPHPCNKDIGRWTADQATNLVWANLAYALALLLGCWLLCVCVLRVWRARQVVA